MTRKDDNKTPFFVNRDKTVPTKDYIEWLGDLKKRYRKAQVRAAVKVNGEMLQFYWSLGRDILVKNADAKWGSGFLKQLSIDLQKEFPNNSGLSYRNLRYARQWFSFYFQLINWQQPVANLESDGTNSIRQQAVAKLQQEEISVGQQSVGKFEMPDFFGEIGWSHHILIMSKAKDLNEALFYIHKDIEEGLSREDLRHFIENDEYGKHGHALTNFSETLPTVQGNLAKEILKSPYNFDFLQMGEEYSERDFEDKLSRHITDFLLELGNGFAFVGRQKELVMPSGKSYRPDMIFYHTRLHCYVVCELKVVDFEPEFAGKLNFYVSAVDELMKGEGDNPTIGLLICKHKDDMTVEWSFRGMDRPLGVAEYENEMKKIKDMLPSADDIKANLEAEVDKE